MEEKVTINEAGKLDAFGLGISISDIVGGKIVDEWFAQLTPDDMQLIYNAIEGELFSHGYNDEKFFKKTVTTSTSSYHWHDKTEDTPIWRITKSKFSEKYNEIILSKVDEILSSEKYQERATEIAQEIVDYATEGYKTDMMNRVRERLVNNSLDSQPQFDQVNLRYIIQKTVSEMFPNVNGCY